MAVSIQFYAGEYKGASERPPGSLTSPSSYPFLDNPCCKNKPAADNDEHTPVNKRRECIQRCTMHAERQAMNKRVDEYPV